VRFQNKYPDSVRSRVVEAYSQNTKTLTSIAHAENIPISTACHWIKRAGLKIRRDWKKGVHSERISKLVPTILKLYKTKPFHAIQKELGVGTWIIYKVLRENGVQVRSSRCEKNSHIKDCHETAFLAYVAGLVDGEGCISKVHNSWRVQIYNTNPKIVEFVKINFGGSSCQRIRSDQNPKYKPEHTWYASSAIDVEKFLTQIVPYLVIKQAKAQQAIIDSKKAQGFFEEEVVAN
jgi:hypothetical protein